MAAGSYRDGVLRHRRAHRLAALLAPQVAALGIVALALAPTLLAAGPPFPAPVAGQRVYDEAGVLKPLVIGLTEQPISTTKGKIYDWGIAGLGQLPGKSCVLTAYLFRGLKKKDRAHYLRYMENLVLHELGHTLGVDHCPLDRCIMADAKGNALRAARASINEYCPRCHNQLRQWLRAKEVRGDWPEFK